jgi:hypothetical protein
MVCNHQMEQQQMAYLVKIIKLGKEHVGIKEK